MRTKKVYTDVLRIKDGTGVSTLEADTYVSREVLDMVDKAYQKELDRHRMYHNIYRKKYV